MQRLSKTLAAAGAAMCVACSGDPPTAVHSNRERPNLAPDSQLVRMSAVARDYLEQLRTGHAGRLLNDTQKRARLQHVERFINATDSAIVASRFGLPRATAEFEEEPETPTESGTAPINVFVASGTFTDLCLSCQNATSFVETSILGILSSTTTTTITTAGRTYNPTSGTITCPSAFCLSSINLSPIVDCRVSAASGTASGTASWMWRLKPINVESFSANTYDSDDCLPPPPIAVTLDSPDISVGASTQAISSCAGYVQWSSNAPAVASVSSYGVVTGNGAGSAEISATCGANRGSAMISIHLAEQEPQTQSDPCDDPMTPAVDSCDDPSAQLDAPFGVSYTRPGVYGEAEDSWFTDASYTQVYTVVCDVTDWYQWNSDHSAKIYLDTEINSCWLQPYFGSEH